MSSDPVPQVATPPPSAYDTTPFIPAPLVWSRQALTIADTEYLNDASPLCVSRAEVWMLTPGTVCFNIIYDNTYAVLHSELWVNERTGGSTGLKIFKVPDKHQAMPCRFALKNCNTGAAIFVSNVKLFGIPTASPPSSSSSSAPLAPPGSFPPPLSRPRPSFSFA